MYLYDHPSGDKEVVGGGEPLMTVMTLVVVVMLPRRIFSLASACNWRDHRDTIGAPSGHHVDAIGTPCGHHRGHHVHARLSRATAVRLVVVLIVTVVVMAMVIVMVDC